MKRDALSRRPGPGLCLSGTGGLLFWNRTGMAASLFPPGRVLLLFGVPAAPCPFLRVITGAWEVLAVRWAAFRATANGDGLSLPS